MSRDLSRDMKVAIELMQAGRSPFSDVSGSARLGRGGTMRGLVRRGLVERADGGGYRLTVCTAHGCWFVECGCAPARPVGFRP